MSTQPPLPPQSPEPDNNRDSLTGAYNARYFRELLELETARARRYKVPVSLLKVGIGNFSTFGHINGDKVLKAVADLIRESVRMTDLVGRTGEAEFAIILTHTEPVSASYVCHRLKMGIVTLQLPDDLRDVVVSLSFGVGQYQPRESPDSFIKRANQALERAKNDDDLDDGLLGVPERV